MSVFNLTSIMGFVQSQESSLTEPFFDAVINRLDSLGYSAIDVDAWMIAFTGMKVENKVKGSCNTTTIPDGLFQVAVDMVCGEFLLVKKTSGQLIGFDTSSAVKSIQEGDTNVTFAVTEACELDVLIRYLQSGGESKMVSYRRLSW